MAARTWGGGSNTPATGSWKVAANWTGDTVPQNNDLITFDGTDTTDCTVDVATNVMLEVTMAAGYTGTLTPQFAVSTYDWVLASGTVDNSVHNPSHLIKGNFTQTGGTWTRGNGILDFQGNVLQDINFTDALEDIRITQTSIAIFRLQNDLSCKSIKVTDGIFNPNGYDVTASGSIIIDASTGAEVRGVGLNGSTITTSSFIRWLGKAGNLLDFNATATWYLDVTDGDNSTVEYVEVAYSDASAGEQIDASDGTSVDSVVGSTTNWLWNSPIDIAQRGGITINHGAAEPIVRQNSALTGELTKSDRLTGEFSKEGRLTGNLTAKDRLTGVIEHE